MTKPKIALIHEWIESIGGSENVVDAIYRSTNSDVYCLWNKSESFENANQSWLAKTPLRNHKTLATPFMPFVWRKLVADQDYDLVLSSSHLFAHHARFVNLPRSIPKLAYVHTPARYIWEPELDPRGGQPLVRFASKLLQPLDKNRASELTGIAANSEFVARRVRRVWDRESTVVYPPVNTVEISSGNWQEDLTPMDLAVLESLPDSFVLGASRFVEYKRLEDVISVGIVADVPVVLAGAGSDRGRLEQIALQASVPVIFVDNPSNALLYALYRSCLTYVFPSIEDFGIMPVEAMAAGASVMVNSVGGASESVIDGSCGAHVDFSSEESIRNGLSVASLVGSSVVQERAEHFSADKFSSRLLDWLSEYHAGFQKTEETSVIS